MKFNKMEQTSELKSTREMLNVFLGKEVDISIRNGTKLKGRLESVSTYELVITMSHKPVVVLKHAIDFVELAEYDCHNRSGISYTSLFNRQL